MALLDEPRRKTVVINGAEYELQSPSVDWFLDFQTRHRLGSDNVNNKAFADDLLRNVVIKPPEIKVLGIKYFGYDIYSQQSLAQEAASFLVSPVGHGGGAAEG
jgi:hypothetical protein